MGSSLRSRREARTVASQRTSSRDGVVCRCTMCGWPPDMVQTTILFPCPQDGLTKSPPDPRPICPACKLPDGGIVLMCAETEERGDAPCGDPEWDDAG
jgi:hypothetical protein